MFVYSQIDRLQLQYMYGDKMKDKSYITYVTKIEGKV